MNKLAIAVLLLLAMLGFAAPAQAYGSHTVRVHLVWGPAPCVTYNGPAANNQMQLITDVLCRGHGDFDTTYTAPGGAITGADPIMDRGNTYLACQVWIDGVSQTYDGGTAGDGHDINCLVAVP